MAQIQEEKIKIRMPPRVKKKIQTEIPSNFIKKGQLKVKQVQTVGYVPELVYNNGEEITVGPVDYVIVYDPLHKTEWAKGRKIVSVGTFKNMIRGRIVVPVSSKDFAQRVFVLAELNRFGNKVIRYYFLVRPELIKSSKSS